ncbi:ribitol 2-dehydrogenase [Palleronia aestuarii]|uniref:Ribitol 2-dehydrogenase n=1 Tax=Palleronia aestuarii TaxID=568105 RepID=A0A2W7NKN3_9RHOB|nr:SDR family oxidoreductase [Palleronia aestuarii]PZX13746.1 ribitol 2-dehydrogenase [Palleronia aestuarii]
MTELTGKTVLVTGASTGIGLETARLLAKAGARVGLAARSTEKLERAVAEIGDNAVAITADVAAPGGVDAMVDAAEDALGPLDIVMPNAGIYLGGDLIEADPDQIERVIRTNILGVFSLVRRVLPGMIERGQGDILVTSSVAGHQMIPWEPVYSPTKHAVQGLVHSLRQQVGKNDVRVMAVAPGVVLNDLWGISDPAEIDRKADAGEGLRSEDVAEAVMFMLTRPRNVTIRDLVILPRSQQI